MASFLCTEPPARHCLLYTNPHPGICDVSQSALGGTLSIR
uniref:Uncharacterized protein n=1 Tax=Escherichia coli TaxID=562 RepID=A0A6G5ZYP3_ECOLX|nr:hypothetical protein [Escherichia coli]